MKLFQYKTIKTDIVVEIVSYTGDKKSPGVDKWAKNIIDIMHKTEYLSNPSDAHPLCQDRCRLMEGHLYEVYNNI